MKRLLGPAICAALAFHTSSLCAQTDDDLRKLWLRRDLARMEEIARAGDARAEAWMGLMLQNRGRRDEAKVWWRRAAEKGNRWAINSLAFMHLGDKEDEEAAHWYLRGAEAGDPDSQFMYAWLLLQGRGVPRNEGEAARWYSAAAAQGHGDSYFELARLFAEGIGVSPNTVEAYALASIAEVAVDPSEADRASQLKARLAQDLSSEQIKAAVLRANAIRPDLERTLKDRRTWESFSLALRALLALALFLVLTAITWRVGRWVTGRLEGTVPN
jgi:TPR repeat protein